MHPNLGYAANRHISATDYNLHSSRSHTVFQMIIESKERNSTSITMMNGRRRTLSTNRNGLTKEPIKISQLVRRDVEICLDLLMIKNYIYTIELN